MPRRRGETLLEYIARINARADAAEGKTSTNPFQEAYRQRQREKEASSGKSAFKKYVPGSGRRESRGKNGELVVSYAPNGSQTRRARDGRTATAESGLTEAERQRFAAEAQEERDRLKAIAMRALKRRAGIINTKLERRLAVIEAKRAKALEQATLATERRRIAVENKDIAGVAAAQHDIQRANFALLAAEHEEATAYGLHQRSSGFDVMKARNAVMMGQRAYTARALGDPAPVGELLAPEGPRGEYGYGNKVRDQYEHAFTTKAGQSGHGKEVRRAMAVDVAMLATHAEWFDTPEGREASADVFNAHNEEIRKHAELVNTRIDPYVQKQKRLVREFKHAKTPAAKLAVVKKFSALKKDKTYARLVSEQAVIYGKEVLNAKFKVRPGSDMGLVWLYDTGAAYVMSAVKARQQHMLAYGPNKALKLEFEKQLADFNGRVEDLVTGAAKMILDPKTGETRLQTPAEVIAVMESEGMTPEQYAMAHQGFSAGEQVRERMIAMEDDPVLKHIYPALLAEGIEDRDDLDFEENKVHVQLHVMPKILETAMGAWRLSDAYVPPSDDRVFDPANYVELPTGEVGFRRADGSIRTQANWTPLLLTKTGYEREPLWDGCVLDTNPALCSYQQSFSGRAASEDRTYEGKFEGEARKKISDELHLDFRDVLATNPLGFVLSAAMVPVSAFVLEAEGHTKAQFGLIGGADASAFDMKDYEAIAHQAVDDWRAHETYYDPGVRYGLFDQDNYGEDEQGVFFTYTPVVEDPVAPGFPPGVPVKLRVGDRLPVPQNLFWSEQGYIEPFWNDPNAYKSMNADERSRFESMGALRERNRNSAPSWEWLEANRRSHEFSYEENFYRSALSEARGNQVKANRYIDDAEWTNVEELPLSHSELSDTNNPIWNFILNPLVTIAGGKVTRARSKRDGRIREEVSFGIDILGQSFEPLPVRFSVDSGAVVSAQIEREGEAFKRSIMSGKLDIAFEVANETGKVWSFGNASEFGNFVSEFIFDISNWIPGVNIAKRGIHAATAVRAATRTGSAMSKFKSTVGEGFDAFVTHPDKYRLFGAVAKDIERQTGMSNVEVIRWFRQDLLGLVGDVDGVEGWKAAIDRVAEHFFAKNTNLSGPQFHHWVEGMLTKALEVRGIAVHGQLDEALQAYELAKQATVAKNARELELGAEVARQQRWVDEDMKVRSAAALAEERAAAKVKAAEMGVSPAPVGEPVLAGVTPAPTVAHVGEAPRAAGAPAGARAATPPPAAAGPPTAAAGRTTPQRTTGPGFADRPRTVPSPMKPTTTGQQRLTGRGMPPGKKRPMEAKDVVANIEALMKTAERVKMQAKGLPVGMERYNLVRKYRAAEKRVKQLQAEHAGLEYAAKQLDRLDSELNKIIEDPIYKGVRGGFRLKGVRDARIRAILTQGRLSGQPVDAAAIRAAEAESRATLKAATDAQEALADQILVGKFDTVADESIRAIQDLQASVRAELAWADAALHLGSGKALYREVGGSASELNRFLQKSYWTSLKKPPHQRVSHLMARAQAIASSPFGVRAPATLPADVRALYVPRGPTGSLDLALRDQEETADVLWREGQTHGRREVFVNEFSTGGEYHFPTLVPPPGGIADSPMMTAADAAMAGPDPQRAMAAFEFKAQVYEHQWNLFLSQADPSQYPTGYPHWLAGGYADVPNVEALRAQNNAIVNVMSTRRFARDPEDVFLIVDKLGRVPPRVRRVREQDVPFGPEELTREEWIRQQAAEEASTAGFDMRKGVEGRGDRAEPEDFDVYDIAGEIKTYDDLGAGGEWYQPPRPYGSESFGNEFKASAGGVYDSLNDLVTKPGIITGFDDEQLVSLIDQIEGAAKAEFTDGPGALVYRRQIQAVFDLFHSLHGAAMGGDMEAWGTLARLHDQMSERLVRQGLTRTGDAVVHTYLLMEARVGLPFSYRSDFITSQFMDMAVRRGMMPHRAVQMIQHRYNGLAVVTPRELNPSILPIYDVDAGVKRAPGRKEGWGPTQVPVKMISEGKVDIPPYRGRGKPRTLSWTAMFHYSLATQGRRSFVTMVRRSLLLLDTNTARHGSWMSSWGRAAKQSPLRPAALERGVHGLVSAHTVREGGRWVPKDAAGRQQLGALYANFMQEARLKPHGVERYSPQRDLYLVNDETARRLGREVEADGGAWVTFDELRAGGVPEGFVSFDGFVEKLGSVRGLHEQAGSYVRSAGNVAGETRLRVNSKGEVDPQGMYMDYGHTEGLGFAIRIAWEKGTVGAQGYARIRATSPFESVFHYLVHRGYWTDGNWHSAAIKRTQNFLDEMEQWATDLSRPDLYDEARKLVLDMNAPSFDALTRRMSEQAGALTPGNESFMRLELMRQLGVDTSWVERGPDGKWVERHAAGHAIGALYMRANKRTVQSEVDRVIEGMRARKQRITDEDYAPTRSAADEADAVREAFPEREPRFPEAYADMAPAVERLEHSWDLLSTRGDTVTRQAVKVERLHTPDEVAQRLIAWEAEKGNKMPVRPSAGLPEMTRHFEEVAYPRWVDRRARAEQEFAAQTVTVEVGASGSLENFVGDLVNTIGNADMTASDWAKVSTLIDNVKAGLTAHPELSQAIVEAVGKRGDSLARGINHHRYTDLVSKSGDIKKGERGADISTQAPPPPMSPDEIAEVHRYLDPQQGPGPAGLDADRHFLKEWEDGLYTERVAAERRAVAREEQATGNLDAKTFPKGELDRKHTAAERIVALVDRYHDEAAARVEVEADAAHPTSGAMPDPEATARGEYDPALSGQYFRLIQRVQGGDMAVVMDPLTGEPITGLTARHVVAELKRRRRAVDAGRPSDWGEPVRAAPEPEPAPPPPPEPGELPVPPVDPGPTYLDHVMDTDGVADDGTRAQEAGRTIWEALAGEGHTEIGYYYSLMRDVNFRLRERGLSADDVVALRARRDNLALAIRALKRDMGRGKPQRRTIREAAAEAEKVMHLVEDRVPPNRIAYYATTEAGMVTEHYRSLWVRVKKALTHGKVVGEGLPDHVMAAYRPEHYRGMNDAVSAALRGERGRASASLSGTFVAGDEAARDPDDLVKTLFDRDPKTVAIVQRAIAKYCLDNDIPVWSEHLYWRVRTFMESSQGKMRRGIGMLGEVGGDMDAFLNLRKAAAEHEAFQQLKWLLVDNPNMTGEQAAELLQLRFMDSGVVIPHTEALTQTDVVILEGMFKHLSGVTDVEDGAAVRAALQANGTRPPWEGGKFSTREHLESIGKWAPRTGDEVTRLGAWSLYDEREYWRLNYGEVPGWVGDPRIDSGQVFRSREEYLAFQHEVGGLDDSARVERELKEGVSHIRFEDYARGENGLNRTRDWARERAWAMQRYGDLVHKDGVFHTMPWLMTPEELIEYHGKHGPVEGLISTPDEIRSVQHAMQEIVGKYVGYYEAMARAGPDGVAGIASADVHMLTYYMVHQLISTTPWRGITKMHKGRAFLDVVGSLFTGIVMVNPSFTISNLIDTPSKALLFGWSEKYAKRQVSDRTRRMLPSLESIGHGERSAMFYSTGSRAPLERLKNPYGGYQSVGGLTDAAGGLWDGVTSGVARRVLPKVEYASKLRIAQQLYEGMYDEIAQFAATKGVTDEAVIDLMTKRRVSERLNKLFPSLENAGMAERMLNRLLPFISYNAKNKLLWTGWVLDHPWSIDLLQKAQEEIAGYNEAQWLEDHPGWTGALPESLSHQIRIPGTDMFLDIGMFTDAARGAKWITGDGPENMIFDYKGIEAFVKVFVRPLPQQEALFSALVYDLTGFGGRTVVRPVMDEFGVWDPTGGRGDGFVEEYVAPGTAWGDRRFDYLNNMFPFEGTRKVLGDAMRTGDWDLQTAGRIIGSLLTFSEFGHVSETSLLQWQYFVLADRDKLAREQGLESDKAAEWLASTEEGARLKELWNQQRIDPDNPDLADFSHHAFNPFASLFYKENANGDFVFTAPDPKELRKAWASVFMPEPADEIRNAQADLQKVYDQFDDLLLALHPDDQEGREALWASRRAAEGAVYAAHPRYLQYYAFGQSREEYEAHMAKSQLDYERNNFFTMYDWDEAPEEGKERRQWEKDRLRYLQEHPEFAKTLADEASSYQAAVNQVNKAMGDAIDLSESLGRIQDFAYDQDRPDLAGDIGVLRDRNAQAFGMEAMGYDANGEFKYKPDSVWKKLLRGDDPVAVRYSQMMTQVGQQAKGKNGEFEVAKWWRMVNRNPLLRKEHLARKGISPMEWERDGQYYAFWDRWNTLADKGQWDRAWEMYDNAPGWLRERYGQANPKGFADKQKGSAYMAYMGKWVGFFKAGNSQAAMRYFYSLPQWVRDQYYENNPGKMMSNGEHSQYVQTLDRMFNLIDAGNWDAAEKMWNSAPSWMRSQYYANNPDSTLFRGGGGGKGGSGSSLSDPQFRTYLGYMGQWVKLMKQGNDKKADSYFRSLPDWAKRFYLQRNPDKEVLMLNDRLFAQATDYFSADPEEQRLILQRNPALARWLNSHDSKKARFDAISYIYSRLPSDPWLRRVYRERYPEIFSAEAEGRRTRQSIFAILEKHPDLSKEWMAMYKAIAKDVEEALRWAEPRPEQPVLDRSALRQASQGMSAEDVALRRGIPIMREPQERGRTPMAV